MNVRAMGSSVALAAVLLTFVSPVNAAFYRWVQTPTEDQVNNSGVGDGSTDSAATGASEITYDTATGLLEYTVTWASLEGLLTAIHVHGPATPDISVMPHLWNVFTAEQDVIDAAVNRTADTTTAAVLLTDIFGHPGGPAFVLQAMVDELGYVNIHSSLWPRGEIRANLILVEAIVEATKDHPKCINALNAEYAKVQRKAAAEIRKCVKGHAKGKLFGTLKGCLESPKAAVARAQQKIEDKYAKKCAGFDKDGALKRPPYGVSSAMLVGTAAADAELASALATLGPTLDDVDAVVQTNASDKDAAVCQQRVLQAVLKCQQTKVGEFNKCKRDGLKGKSAPPSADLPFDDADDLELCLGHDPKGKIEKFCDPAAGKIADPAIAKKCVGKGVDLSDAFPACGTDDPAALAVCLDRAVECNVCLALNIADDLDRDCDDFDDGSHGSRARCIRHARRGDPRPIAGH